MCWTTVISCIASAVSACAAALACYFALKRDKPRYLMNIDLDESPKSIRNCYYKRKGTQIADISVIFINSSIHPVTIWKIELEINGIKYCALECDEKFDISLIPETNGTNDLPCTPHIGLMPFTIKPFEKVDTLIVFPNFMEPNKEKIKANLYIYATHKKNPKIYKDIPFFDYDKFTK